MITIDDYWMGRDSKYREFCTEEIQKNAKETVRIINLLLDLATMDGIECDEVASGWRPAEVNDATQNSAKSSLHLTAEACDLRDNSARDLARWCLGNRNILATLNLYMEDPQWTWTQNGGWVHLQRKPPASGRRVFIPSTKPPTGPPLSKWRRT